MSPSSKPAQPSVPRTDAELSEFLLRACHDLRGPLRAVRGHSELLVRAASSGQPLDPSGSLGFIVDGCTQAGLLIDSLTDYALALQIDSANFGPVPTDVILRTALAKLARTLSDSEAEVAYDALPKVSGNADRLLQLFEYLVDNAVRNHGKDKPRIRITAERRGSMWLFQVKDNGAGPGTEFLERVFKPFERIRGKERPGPGLATCRVIVERHGGSIWAESPPHGGNTLCFTLPAEED